MYSNIITKTKKLLDINNIEPDYNIKSDSPCSFKSIMKMQEKLMDEIEELSRKHNTLLGRIVTFPVADGHAYYIITKVNKNTARLTWINFCDGYGCEFIGNESNVDINIVKQKIKQRDCIISLVTTKKK